MMINYLKIDIFTLFVLAFLFSCEKKVIEIEEDDKVEDTKLKLIGEWEWIKTYDYEWGDTIYADSVNYKEHLIFKENDSLISIFYENDKIGEHGIFKMDFRIVLDS